MVTIRVSLAGVGGDCGGNGILGKEIEMSEPISRIISKQPITTGIRLTFALGARKKDL
jgi:hypothetical protein